VSRRERHDRSSLRGERFSGVNESDLESGVLAHWLCSWEPQPRGTTQPRPRGSPRRHRRRLLLPLLLLHHHLSSSPSPPPLPLLLLLLPLSSSTPSYFSRYTVSRYRAIPPMRRNRNHVPRRHSFATRASFSEEKEFNLNVSDSFQFLGN